MPSLHRRNSRWTRDPAVERGTPLTACVTDRDVEIFNLLTRYRYLPSDYIHAFIGGNMKALSRRLNCLSRKPNLYLARPHQQRDNVAANYRCLIYELDERGSRVLRERGLSSLPKSYHRNFAHELMVAQIMASMELGIRENKNIRQISWPEILANENTPKATRDLPTAASIPVSFSLNGERYSMAVKADACPFGLERTIDGKRTYVFFPGIEADCATEPIETSDFGRSSINKKFAAYIAIVEQSIHRTHFALAEARKTDFDMQTLGGTKQYLAGYLAMRQHKAAEKVREAARKEKVRQDADQQAYDHFRRTQAGDIFARLPDAEREAIEVQARAHAAKFTGFLRQTMFEFGKVRFTTERHGDKLASFDDWKTNSARI